MADLLVLASNATNHGQGEGDQRPQHEDDADGAEGQRCSGVVCNGHCVEEGEGDEHWPTEQGYSQQHIAHLRRFQPSAKLTGHMVMSTTQSQH